MKRLTLTCVVALLLASPALAWQEGPGIDWWYIDASYGGHHNTVPLVIEIDGDPADGQIFAVGETITITCDLYTVAQSSGGDGNGAYTEWLLEVEGASGNDFTGGWEYDHGSGSVVADTETTLTINYPLTAGGIHTVHMNSYAAVSQYWLDVADDTVEGFLTFVVPLPVAVDIKPGSCPNPFNAKSKGSVPVAIVGTADFDVTTVEPNTITLNGVPALLEFEIKDSTQPDEDNTDCFTCFDADDPANFNCDLWNTDDPDNPVLGTDGVLDSYCGDGYPDLVVKFDTQELADAIGPRERNECVEFVLTGTLFDGTLFEGGDSMVIKTKIK